MGQKKEILMSIFLITSLLLCLNLVIGADFTVVMNSPASSSTVSGTAVNVSVTASNPIHSWNCTIYGKSSLTANSSWSILGGGPLIPNITSTIFNITFNSRIIQDANNYIFNASCSNGTNIAEDTNTEITVDNTIPQAPSITTHSNNQVVSTSGTQTFSYSVIDANTTSCTYTIYRGGSPSDGDSGSGTYSGSTCSFTKEFSTSLNNGNWYITSVASDETNTTSSSTTILNVQLPGGGGGVIDDGGEITWGEKLGSKIPMIILFVGIGCVIIFGLYLLFKKD